jgi:hypothetical protein
MNLNFTPQKYGSYPQAALENGRSGRESGSFYQYLRIDETNAGWRGICPLTPLVMKARILIFFLLFTGVQSARAIDLYEEIANAIRSGDARSVAAFFGPTIDLSILEQEEVYSKTQAEQVLRDFFQKNPPKSFQFLHKGSSREGLQYAIGSLVTASGKTYRTSFYVKTTNGKNVLQELRLEAE